MKFYEIYKSEGGYRVAAAVQNESPIISSSPWFATRGEAAEWRIKDINRKIAAAKKMEKEDGVPSEIVDTVINYFNHLLAAAKKEVA